LILSSNDNPAVEGGSGALDSAFLTKAGRAAGGPVGLDSTFRSGLLPAPFTPGGRSPLALGLPSLGASDLAAGVAGFGAVLPAAACAATGLADTAGLARRGGAASLFGCLAFGRSGSSALIEREMRFSATSTPITLTLTISPTWTASRGS